MVIAFTDFQTWLSATSSLHAVTKEGHAAKTAHQNAVVFLHLLVPLLVTLVYLGLVTMAMLILRCWWLIMIITAMEFLLLSINLTYLDHPGETVYNAKTCHVFSKWSTKVSRVFLGRGMPLQKDSQLGDLPSAPSCPYTCGQEPTFYLALEGQWEESDLQVSGRWSQFPSEHTYEWATASTEKSRTKLWEWQNTKINGEIHLKWALVQKAQRGNAKLL